jgi:catechol 2,3-dioxygenase-like lactoylglutathione lyase family enzyme
LVLAEKASVGSARTKKGGDMSHRKIILACSMALWLGGVAAHAAPPANEGPPPVSALAMMASVIPSSDLERSIAFYTKGLGMTLAGRIENPSGTEAPLQFPGAGAYIILFKPKTETNTPAHGALNRIVLAVPDIKALEAKLIAAGYKLNAPIAEQPKYHVAVGLLQDPDGNHLELVQRLP